MLVTLGLISTLSVPWLFELMVMGDVDGLCINTLHFNELVWVRWKRVLRLGFIAIEASQGAVSLLRDWSCFLSTCWGCGISPTSIHGRVVKGKKGDRSDYYRSKLINHWSSSPAVEYRYGRGTAITAPGGSVWRFRFWSVWTVRASGDKRISRSSLSILGKEEPVSELYWPGV